MIDENSDSNKWNMFFLVVEDDDREFERLNAAMRDHDFGEFGIAGIHRARNVDEAMKISEKHIDISLIDVCLSGNPALKEGHGILRRLRNGGFNGPAILMSAHRKESRHKINGLKDGAARYHVRTDDIELLMTEIKADLTMYSQSTRVEFQLTDDGLMFSPWDRRIYFRTGHVKRNPSIIGSKVLTSIVKRWGKGVDRDTVKREVWGDGVHVENETLAVHVSRVRDLLKDLSSKPKIVFKNGKYYLERRQYPEG